jgi:hypothetical protein
MKLFEFQNHLKIVKNIKDKNEQMLLQHCCKARKNTRNCKPRRSLFKTFLNKRKKKKKKKNMFTLFELSINFNLQVHIGLISFEKKMKKIQKKYIFIPPSL